MRDYSIFDKFCLGLDHCIRAIARVPTPAHRATPANTVEENLLSPSLRRHSAALMRINHSGEISAQALYQAQGLISRDLHIKTKMQQAALEEEDHLAWCQQRVLELGSHTSYLNPVWYAGSFVIGALAGLVGDRLSLGFLAETEQQVVKHLEGHLAALSDKDAKSTAILKQMQEDEAKHRDEAVDAGAAPLPWVVKKVMGVLSKVMVKTAYWI